MGANIFFICERRKWVMSSGDFRVFGRRSCLGDMGVGAMLIAFLHMCRADEVCEWYAEDGCYSDRRGMSLAGFSEVTEDAVECLFENGAAFEFRLGADDDPFGRYLAHVRDENLRCRAPAAEAVRAVEPVAQGVAYKFWLKIRDQQEICNLSFFGGTSLKDLLLDPRACSLCATAFLRHPYAKVSLHACESIEATSPAGYIRKYTDITAAVVAEMVENGTLVSSRDEVNLMSADDVQALVHTGAVAKHERQAVSKSPRLL